MVNGEWRMANGEWRMATDNKGRMVMDNSVKAQQGDELRERCFQFALEIVKTCRKMSRRTGNDWVLIRQVLRSGTSVGANLEEAQGAQSRADFIHKCSIACKEARETLYWLRLLGEAEVIEASVSAPLIKECDQLVAILTAIVKRSKARVENKPLKDSGET
jgi:four helix bundle protein